MTLSQFHPAVSAWFRGAFSAPTAPQESGWPTIQARRHTLIAAPTGSGKTLAAFLCAIDELVRDALAGTLGDETRVLYISPLRALSNDVEKNLRRPLEGIREELAARGLPDVEIRTAVRTSDTPASQRAKAVKRPPHLFVTTPESLYILLTSEGGRRMLSTVRTVIVDEIHALLGDKRGSHLALSLERLGALVGDGLVRIGLSATQRPIETVARFLVGGTAQAAGAGTSEACAIVDGGHARRLDLAVEVPRAPLESVMSAEVWGEIYDRLAVLATSHRTTLIFVNTRRLAERAAMHLGERLGQANVAAHHGSLAKEARLDAEQRLKRGELRVLVATASLELGIDVGEVDLVCQLGTTRSVAAFLQRVGRSGHHLQATPKGRLFPLSRDELVEAAALLWAVRRGELDATIVPDAPLDILAQQIVAEVACREWGEDALYALFRGAYPYRDLSRAQFDAVVRMLADGFTTRRGRRGAHLHYDGVNGVLRGRRGARIAAMTSGGAIPERADYDVVLDPTDTVVGTLDEDFAIESMPGDIFQLGTHAWQIQRVESGQVRVTDAQGLPPTVPFWFGEAPARTAELSTLVSELREAVVERVRFGDEHEGGADTGDAVAWLAQEAGVEEAAGRQLAEYLAACAAPFGVIPSQRTLVLERFFDETESMHLVLHAPFGSRLNRAWGLALRKRFCRSFNFELQAAANEDAICLSLGPTHSFELDTIFRYLDARTVRDVLVQALLDAPMFGTRWRWNASRALAVLRFRGGKRVPPRFQRMDADDLVAVTFPDQLACLENIQGDREVPDHPLVQQTIHDCLTEAMDIEGLEAVLRAMASGELRLVARDLREPSPLAHEILNARPYAFLDDAPLEERRTMAVQARRWLDAKTAAELAFLEPDAIARVRAEAWPDPRTPDELHDALILAGALRDDEWQGRGAEAAPRQLFDALVEAGRAYVFAVGEARLWVAAERVTALAAVWPEARREPSGPLPPRLSAAQVAGAGQADRDTALVELVRGRLEIAGPITARALSATLALPLGDVGIALAALEAEGFAFRGSYSSEVAEEEWCQRRLLARIHRYTLRQLRESIQPVSKADFMRFLLGWQRVTDKAEGPEGLADVLAQLEGFEVPAGAWESDVLPARMAGYDPSWLDALCLSGRVVWARLRAPGGSDGDGPAPSPIRSSPIALLARREASLWQEAAAGEGGARALSEAAGAVQRCLEEGGAQFFDDLARHLGWTDEAVSDALGELVGAGRVTADSFAGLRALLLPAARRARPTRGLRSGVTPMHGAGRWSLLAAPSAGAAGDGSRGTAVEHAARVLLRRYGVVFRALLEREGTVPPWRELLAVLRRLEDRGEVRGGRFVSGFAGEQFALPEAIAPLRAVRRSERDGREVTLSGADPLNLVGIVLPGERVAALAGRCVVLKDGEAVRIRGADDSDPDQAGAVAAEHTVDQLVEGAREVADGDVVEQLLEGAEAADGREVDVAR
jgi:ATP-dependent Lhr-like helicase